MVAVIHTFEGQGVAKKTQQTTVKWETRHEGIDIFCDDPVLATQSAGTVPLLVVRTHLYGVGTTLSSR